MDYLITHNLNLNIWYSLSHIQITLSIRLFLVNQKHAAQPLKSHSQTSDSYELILLMNPLKELRNNQLNQSAYCSLNEFIKCIRALLSIKEYCCKK